MPKTERRAQLISPLGLIAPRCRSTIAQSLGCGVVAPLQEHILGSYVTANPKPSGFRLRNPLGFVIGGGDVPATVSRSAPRGAGAPSGERSVTERE